MILHSEVHTSMMYGKIFHFYSSVMFPSCGSAFCPEKVPHHDAQGGSSETATFMLTLNISCCGLHCIDSSLPADNRPLGTGHDAQLLVHLVPEIPVLTDRSSTFPEGYIAAYQNQFIWFALTNKASLETAARASGISSNAIRWLISLGSDFFPCRTVSSSYPFLLLPPGASC